MDVTLKHLSTAYASAMHEGDAALFIGSGMSRPAGFVDWRGFLKKSALEIGLDVDREQHNLVELAQFYLNSRRDRSALNQALIDEFSKTLPSTVHHRILAGLPVSTIWTTNYDLLIEDALRKKSKSVDVKLRDGDIAWRKPGRAVVLYKMHGDIGHPQEIVICKDDYERYPRTHPIFQNALEGDLLSKTFLFLGFSFRDPNLAQMLGHLRSLLQESKRAHYAVMRRVRLDWNKPSTKAHQDFEYETAKQNHDVENLQRYSIYTHLVDRYSDIKPVLRGLEREYARRFIYLWIREADQHQAVKLAQLAGKLGARLLENEYRLCCEFDRPLGREVFAAAMSQIVKKHLHPPNKYLLRPMPMRKNETVLSASEFASESKKAMVRQSGFVIFLGGNKSNYSEIAKDFAFAQRVKTVSIPVGSSGSAAETIWGCIAPDPNRVYGAAVSVETFRTLNDKNCDTDTVVKAILDIIRNACSVKPKLPPEPDLSQSIRRLVYETLKQKYCERLPDRTLRRIAGNL